MSQAENVYTTPTPPASKEAHTPGRRAFLAGLAAVPVAIAAPAAIAGTSEPDPIFAAIEANRAAHIASDEPGAPNDEIDDLYDEYVRTFDVLRATKPTTPEGALCLVIYMREHQQRRGELNLEDCTADCLDIAASAAALFVPWADLSAPAPDTDALPPMPENFIHHRPGYVAAWVPASDGGGWILVSREYLEEFRRTCPNAIIAEIPGHGTREG